MTQVDEPKLEPGAVLATLPYRVTDDGTKVYQIPISPSGKTIVKPMSKIAGSKTASVRRRSRSRRK